MGCVHARTCQQSAMHMRSLCCFSKQALVGFDLQPMTSLAHAKPYALLGTAKPDPCSVHPDSSVMLTRLVPISQALAAKMLLFIWDLCRPYIGAPAETCIRTRSMFTSQQSRMGLPGCS